MLGQQFGCSRDEFHARRLQSGLISRIAYLGDPSIPCRQSMEQQPRLVTIVVPAFPEPDESAPSLTVDLGHYATWLLCSSGSFWLIHTASTQSRKGALGSQPDSS